MAQSRGPWRLVGALALGALVAAGLHAVLARIDGTLYDASILSGWLLFGLTAALTACVWFPRFERAALRLQLRWFAVLAVAAAVFFTGHVRRVPPIGLGDLVLTLLFVLVVASSLQGLVLARRLDAPCSATDTLALTQRLRRWLLLQAMLLGLLLGSGLMHGVLVHGHGFLADLAEG